MQHGCSEPSSAMLWATSTTAFVKPSAMS